MDVSILSQACIQYRNVLLETVQTDPWAYTTLSATAMSVFRNHFMIEDSIIQQRPDHISSKKEHHWVGQCEEAAGYRFERDVNIKVTSLDRRMKLNAFGNTPNCHQCGEPTSISKSSTDAHKTELYYAQSCCQPARANFQQFCPHETIERYEQCMKLGLINARKVNVDAFDSETNTCYMYDGCYFHGCTCQPEDSIALQRRNQTIEDTLDLENTCR